MDDVRAFEKEYSRTVEKENARPQQRQSTPHLPLKRPRCIEAHQSRLDVEISDESLLAFDLDLAIASHYAAREQARSDQHQQAATALIGTCTATTTGSLHASEGATLRDHTHAQGWDTAVPPVARMTSSRPEGAGATPAAAADSRGVGAWTSRSHRDQANIDRLRAFLDHAEQVTIVVASKS